MSEFREPWKLDYADDIRDATDTPMEPFDFARAERTVACVNFCRNLQTEWLQKHVATCTYTGIGEWAHPRTVFFEEISE